MNLTWHKLGASGESYPAAIRKLTRSSGVYAIRHVGWLFSTVVYVGESHTGALYKTLVRHFQAWRRGKSPQWYPVRYAPEQSDPGHTYNRADHEVAFRVSSSRALELQSEWIDKLKPRDNIIIPSEEEVPF